MEKLLYYLWNHKLFVPKPLATTDGQPVEVLFPGVLNRHAGPDFAGAKVRIGTTTWAGDVEIHVKASDWFRHNHHTDPHYNNVVLHVVLYDDGQAITAHGEQVPQLVMEVPTYMADNYHHLCHTTDYPRCHAILPTLDPFVVNSWLDRLLYERLEERAQLVAGRAQQLQGDWEKAYFITLARNFGFGINGDAFEHWAQRIPLAQAAHHRDNLFQIEALFMGQAGLLHPDALPRNHRTEALADDYYRRLSQEYHYLAHKFGLQAMDAQEWKFLRLRPQGFPHVRIAQLAQLYSHDALGLSRLLSADSMESWHKLLTDGTSTYWQEHYAFGCPNARTGRRLSRHTLDLIAINTAVPVLYAYGQHQGKEELKEQALQLLAHMAPEDNHIIRTWADCGIKALHAAHSQALIQLRRNYCERRYCLHCRIGYEYLKCKNKP